MWIVQSSYSGDHRGVVSTCDVVLPVFGATEA
jgi:hypothetical protein